MVAFFFIQNPKFFFQKKNFIMYLVNICENKSSQFFFLLWDARTFFFLLWDARTCLRARPVCLQTVFLLWDARGRWRCEKWKKRHIKVIFAKIPHKIFFWQKYFGFVYKRCVNICAYNYFLKKNILKISENFRVPAFFASNLRLSEHEWYIYVKQAN